MTIHSLCTRAAAPALFVLALIAAPAAAQSTQSDVSGANVTSSASTLAPAPAATSVSVAQVVGALEGGTFTANGQPVQAEIQTGLSTILRGDIDATEARAFAGALGAGGTEFTVALAGFAASPSGDAFNVAVAAFNRIVDGGAASLAETPQFQAAYAVMSQFRARFN